MKINRVVLAYDDNPIYSEFVSPISQCYWEKFGMTAEPLDFCGSKIRVNPEYPAGWQKAWAIFWASQFNRQDTFLTMGIDQILLSDIIQKKIADIPDDEYVTMVDDAYRSSWDKGCVSPSSYNIATGETMMKVFGFERDFEDEIEKIVASGIKPYYDEKTMWGLDEAYMSHKLRQYRDAGGKIRKLDMFGFIKEHRIECERVKEPSYDADRLSKGLYVDAHFCRPYSQHKEYIDKILSLIPICR